MVVLRISLRRTTERSATESTPGRVCQRSKTYGSMADFNRRSTARSSRVVSLRSGRRKTHGELLHELRARQCVRTWRVVLLSRCFSNQINRRRPGAASVDSRSRGYASPEPLAGNTFSCYSRDFLSTGRTDCRHEHWRATHPGGLCFFVRSYRWCYMDIDPDESKVDLRCGNSISINVE
jgi:hypothetical protein